MRVNTIRGAPVAIAAVALLAAAAQTAAGFATRAGMTNAPRQSNLNGGSQPSAQDLAVQRGLRNLRTAEDFKQKNGPGWALKFDPKTGLARRIFGGAAGPYPGTPAEAARTFLESHKALFALNLDGLELKFVETRPIPKRSRVKFQLQYRGLDIYQGSILVFVRNDGSVTSVVSNAHPVRGLDLKPGLTVEAVKKNLSQKLGADLEFRHAPNLLVYPEGAGILAYRCQVSTGLPGRKTPHEYILDAQTGAILRSTKLVLDGNDAKQKSAPTADDPHTQDRPPAG